MNNRSTQFPRSSKYPRSGVRNPSLLVIVKPCVITKLNKLETQRYFWKQSQLTVFSIILQHDISASLHFHRKCLLFLSLLCTGVVAHLLFLLLKFEKTLLHP